MHRSTRLALAALAASALAGCRGHQQAASDTSSVAAAPAPGESAYVNPQLADTAVSRDRIGLPRAVSGVKPVTTPATTPVTPQPGVAPAQQPVTVPGALPAAAPTPAAPTPAPAAAGRNNISGAAAAPAAPATPTLASILAALPFAPGERMDYQVKFGPISVGGATMETVGVEELRGTPTVHARFRVNGGMRLYRVNDLYETWFDPRTFSSLRFVQQIDEGSYEKERDYDIYPNRSLFTENGGAEQTSVSAPLDDASFIYFLRTVPLEVGKTYSFDRYFRPDRNPVKVTVVRKERITVPAGTFNTIVVQPSIRSKGVFSEGGHALVWFTDDSLRAMVQMKSQLKFGSLNLYLKSLKPGTR